MSKIEGSPLLKEVENHPKKRNFWEALAWEHWQEMRLNFAVGKLYHSKKSKDSDPWRPTVEHELVEGLAGDVLAEMLGISLRIRKALQKNFLIHDYSKRLQKQGLGMDGRARSLNEALINGTDYQRKWIAATKPEFLAKYDQGGANLMEMMMFYIDDITMGSQIVSLQERIDEVSKSRRTPGHDWEKEMRVAKEIEHRLAETVRATGKKLEKDDELPVLILLGIKKRMDQFISQDFQKPAVHKAPRSGQSRKQA